MRASSSVAEDGELCLVLLLFGVHSSCGGACWRTKLRRKQEGTTSAWYREVVSCASFWGGRRLSVLRGEAGSFERNFRACSQLPPTALEQAVAYWGKCSGGGEGTGGGLVCSPVFGEKWS